MSGSFENVHTVNKFWDRPRSGIADFEGSPHHYECIFDENADEWSTIYILKPISEETLKLALERYEIGLRWSVALREGKVKINPEKFIPLPEDQKRFDEIELLLRDQLSFALPRQFKANGKFRRTVEAKDYSSYGPWEVCWEAQQ